ncbi:MAG: low molecular weight phosphotyrosine protein phosphatase [Gammaproteobacteria bacterium]|nr:low molecular weight phosphotyrosine protein phosphatase [Gammaproteobacteria bacterium]
MIRVLFVCMGNICRSPTAHGVFRKMLQEHSPDLPIELDSAGTGDWHVGQPPDSRATEAASRRGVDISDLRARTVCDEDFALYDYILAMDDLNLVTLQDRSPGKYHAKIRLLMEFAEQPSNRNVPDPYYGGPAGFEQVLDLLENAGRGLLRELEHLLESRGHRQR